jgi:DNA-binding response OmpR family regulator
MQTILVIEDDRAIRGAIVDILELEGYHALSAADGLTGVALAREKRPDLIICDIMMPFLDGYGVLAHLRKHAETATIPFIFLTARTTPNDVRYGMNLGADDYLTKPFKAEELLSTLQARLERHARLTDKLQRRVDELHNNLLSVLPHELNTPLHGMMAGIELLKDEYGSLEPSDVEELIWVIHQSALRMRRLVSNSLLHAELDSMTAAADEIWRFAPNVSVAVTIESAARQEAASAARVADLHVEVQDAVIHISPAHLSKIVEETLNNAFKYSKFGTRVKVAGYPMQGAYWLTIKDYGMGMSAEQIAATGAFQQFQRKRHEQQGLGLGLEISQRLLALYGGKLLLESVLGEHTTVRIMLPLTNSGGSPAVEARQPVYTTPNSA